MTIKNYYLIDYVHSLFHYYSAFITNKDCNFVIMDNQNFIIKDKDYNFIVMDNFS